jgi:hypothetical protein
MTEFLKRDPTYILESAFSFEACEKLVKLLLTPGREFGLVTVNDLSSFPKNCLNISVPAPPAEAGVDG